MMLSGQEWRGRPDWRQMLGWCVVAIVAFHLAYATSSGAPVILGYLYALLQLARLATWRQAFYSGLAVGLLTVGPQLSCFWVIFGPLAIVLWLILSFWIGLFVALARLCFVRFRVTPGLLLIPFVWTGLEYFRSELYYLKFSWLNVGYAFSGIELPLLHWCGMYGVGFVAVAFVAMLSSWRRQGAALLALVGSVLACSVVAALPAHLSGQTSRLTPLKSLRVAGVQLEFPSVGEVIAALDRLISTEPGAELLVLSEYTFFGPVPEGIKHWCRRHQRYLVVGAEDAAANATYYDTVFVIGPAGEIVFRQAKSVPIQFFRDGLAAKTQQLWESPWGKLGFCICYDLSYTRVIDALIRMGAQAVIVPTMDVADWGERQHRLHARVAPTRAAEYGVPIFRLASSGISQLTDASGKVLVWAGMPGQGAVVAGSLNLVETGALPLDRRVAPFSSGVVAALMLVFLVRRRRREASGRTNDARPAGTGSRHLVARFSQRTFLRWLLGWLYGFRAFGEAGLRASGPVLLLPNHVSWWDWLLIGVCLEDDWRFVTSSTTAELSWIHRKIMINRRTFPVDMTSPYAVKRMAEYLQRGGRMVLFPEGRISRTGSLMKLFEGTGFLMAKTRPKVITAYIRGGQSLPFSRNGAQKRWFPRLSVHFSEVLVTPMWTATKPTETRRRLTEWLRQQMIRQRFEVEMSFGPATVPEAIQQTAHEHPGKVALQDVTLQEVSFRRLLIGARLLGRQWAVILARDQPRTGVLLPNVNAMPIVVLSLWVANKTPAILNYSMGKGGLVSCARLAGVKEIITSRTFLERAKLDLAPLQEAGMRVIFVEDVRSSIPASRKLLAVLGSWLGLGGDVVNPAVTPEATAVVLFTSGSEGEPKGVELTHRNLLANVQQMLSVIDVMDGDRLLNALPLFHSFGLTVGTLLPLIRGVYTLLYVSPLHYHVVPAAFYNLDCTILLGTNTFLSGYARKAHPFDFRSLRYVFAGGEKILASTATLWMQKFGIRILEGYGATECSPCLTVNVPMGHRMNSAGQFLPGIEHRLEPVEGVAAEDSAAVGRLFVRGPNVMHGYLNAEPNASFRALAGWYDTGDVVRVDADGFVFVQGRLKRFAKVSGEMVSLAAVEDALTSAFPQFGMRFAVAILARPDEAKGEKLIAVTNEVRLGPTEVREALRARGFSNLSLPREIKCIREMPRLGTGKVNLRELEKMMERENV